MVVSVCFVALQWVHALFTNPHHLLRGDRLLLWPICYYQQPDGSPGVQWSVNIDAAAEHFLHSAGERLIGVFAKPIPCEPLPQDESMRNYLQQRWSIWQEYTLSCREAYITSEEAAVAVREAKRLGAELVVFGPLLQLMRARVSVAYFGGRARYVVTETTNTSTAYRFVQVGALFLTVVDPVHYVIGGVVRKRRIRQEQPMKFELGK